MSTTADPALWAENLRSLATRVLASDPIDPGTHEDDKRAFLSGFRDEMMARPSVVTPFLADLLCVSTAPAPAAQEADDALWWLLHAGNPLRGVRIRSQDGPLLHAPGDQTAIEVRTQRELCALHALSEIAVRTGDPALSRRCRDAALWHLRELQPDNATNHPWAIQVFIRLANAAEGADERHAAMIHAQMQLHSCQVAMGRPDRLSACILLHAARSLERTPVDDF